MKSKLLMLTFSAVFAVSASAQNAPVATNDPNDKTPPKIGNQKVCDTLVKKIRPKGESCLKIKEVTKRSQCFDKIEQEINRATLNSDKCDSAIGPVKQEMISREKQIYPNQTSASGGDQKKQEMPHKPGMQEKQGMANHPMPGNPGMQQPTMAVVDPKICESIAKKVRPEAEKCLKLKEQEKRSQCFEKIGQEINKGAPNDGCDPMLAPIKQEFVSREKQTYPDQTSALDGHGPQDGQRSQPQQGMPQQPQGSQGMQGQPMQGQPVAMPQSQMAPKINPIVCEKLSKTVRPEGDKCLKLKDQVKRSQCFDKIGNLINKSAGNGECDQILDPLKQEFMSREKQIYSDQEPALK